MIRKSVFLVSAAALMLGGLSAPVMAKPGNGNSGNGNSGNGNSGKPAPAPAPAPAPTPTLGVCADTVGVVVQSAGYLGCQGYFSGNAISGNKAGEAVQKAAVEALGGTFGGTWLAKITGDENTKTIDFGQMLYGETIIGAHFGNIYNPTQSLLGGQGNNENVTVFWKFDFGMQGASGLTLLNAQGFSNAGLFVTVSAPPPPPVPEPSAWALMIVGFGAAGAAMRRRQRLVAASA